MHCSNLTVYSITSSAHASSDGAASGRQSRLLARDELRSPERFRLCNEVTRRSRSLTSNVAYWHKADVPLASTNVCCCEGFRMTAHRDDAACTGAVVRKPPMKETALGERVAVPRALIYRGLTLAAAVICQHNFCVMARTLLRVENSFCIMCNFKELRVAKIAHISTSALCA